MPHASDVQSSPIAPALPSGLAAEIRRRKRQRTKDKQVIVLGPTRGGCPSHPPRRNAGAH
jgi:hypothetical protein